MKKISLLSFAMLACFAILFTSCEEEALPLQNDGLTIQDDGAMDLKKGPMYPTIVLEDSDWLTAELVSAAADPEVPGDYIFTVEWTLTPEANLAELVKTQGGLTAGVELGEFLNLTFPKAKGNNPKKNFILWDEQDGLLLDGTITYTVTFTKTITALPGEEVELTGDWTSKWQEEEPVLVDPDEIPDSGDEYLATMCHQVGYEDPVMWTVL